jgi:hypothetical protein
MCVFNSYAATADSANIDFGPYCGATTHSGATIVYRTVSITATCYVVASLNSDLSGFVTSDTLLVASMPDKVLKFKFKHLLSDQTYYYGLVIDGVLQKDGRGIFKTYPSSRQSFNFAFGNSLAHATGRMDQSGLVAAVTQNPLFFLNTGDVHYADISVNNITTYRNEFYKALRRPTDRYMGERTSFVYIWDDHDFGPNDSDKNAPGRPSARQSYQEIFPHYPLAAGVGDVPIYQTFSVGTVRFIMTDLRSERDPKVNTDNESKTMMGAAQRDWLLNELWQSSQSHDFVFWVSTVPYVATKSTGADHWGGYTNERTMIANFIAEKGIKNLMIISGDAHCLAANNGLNANYATTGTAFIPEALASPLDNDNTSTKAGPWSQGTYSPPIGANAYGLMSVDFDTYSDSVKVRYSGRDNNHVERITLAYTTQINSSITTGVFSQKETGLNIYPNPTSGMFTVESETAKFIQVFDVNGVLVFENAMSKSIQVDLSCMKGVFVVRSDNPAIDSSLIVVK